MPLPPRLRFGLRCLGLQLIPKMNTAVGYKPVLRQMAKVLRGCQFIIWRSRSPTIAKGALSERKRRQGELPRHLLWTTVHRSAAEEPGAAVGRSQL